MSKAFNESVVEEAALEWLRDLGYAILHGPDIAPGESSAERESYDHAFLGRRLRQSLESLNPDLHPDAIEEAYRKLTRQDTPSLITGNHSMHKRLVEGVPVENRRKDGSTYNVDALVIDFEKPEANEFLAVNQFTIVEGGHERRADIALFVNGLPLAVIELKNAADKDADIWKAFNQLQTYKQEIPSLFLHNEALVVSDGLYARIGSLTADRERFMPWRTTDGKKLAPDSAPKLQVLLEGVFEKRRFLDLIRYFTVFEDDGTGKLIKKMAGYHQFHAVNRAIESTIMASKAEGSRRIGVVWHTQGSGKSLTMAFYAGRAATSPEMKNPTVIVITDRNDLDDQLYDTFAKCHDILRQPPVQAQSRADMREKLKVDCGGVIFTTVQKFFPAEGEDGHPLLSDRRNIIVIADEAHRSQYDFIDGFARHMREALPNASFIGFTGTPIESSDRNTKAVFGECISIYDIEQAVKDGATVPIYYESRLAKLALDDAQRPRLDKAFEEATEGEELEHKERLKTKWAQLEAVVGSEARVGLVARDIVAHFEKRLEVMDGKALIVCMSRRICVDLYNAICRIHPEWHSEDDSNGTIKIVMTGSASDPSEWQGHIRTKQERDALAKRFKNPADTLKIVIVRDMWLTGFDVPCLHTMYADKPMRGHGLMQAIARVNRVFKDKPGGLVVDYLGLFQELKAALAVYTESGGKGKTAIDQEEAVGLMLKSYEICKGLFHDFNWSKWKNGAKAQLSILPAAQEHVLAQKDGKNRLSKAVAELSKAFALSVPHEKALAITDDIEFFQTIKAVLLKDGGDSEKKNPQDLDHAIKQIVSKAIASDKVIDIFDAAGLKRPEISVLTEEFLSEIKKMPQRNLAIEMLKKLLEGEIKIRGRKNIVQARSFLDLLEKSIRRYQNRAIEAAQVIEEMISLAKDIHKSDEKGKELGLSADELAFYTALTQNDSAAKVMGDKSLCFIAQELVKAVRKNLKTDWNIREDVRSEMRVLIKRILRKYGYPPDAQPEATALVLEQAETLAESGLLEAN